MDFGYKATEWFDHLDDMKVPMKEFSAKLVQDGHTCTQMGPYYIGWCGADVCTGTAIKLNI